MHELHVHNYNESMDGLSCQLSVFLLSSFSLSPCDKAAAQQSATHALYLEEIFSRILYLHLYFSLGHPFPANTERFHIFLRLFSTFGLMLQNVITFGGGGVCVCFSKSVRKRRFRNVWVGEGGAGGHSFAHRAVNRRTHRAQAMLQGSPMIPNPIRCHCCPFPQGPGLHWGTHPPACDWENTSSTFPNPVACVL